MREFAADAQTTVHPQTVIEHFGSWNAAKRQAGLVPRRFATRDELLGRLQALGEELGRTPTARDIDARKGAMPSKSLLWHTFGSLAAALREAGFDVPVGEERLERAVEQGGALARRLGRLPKMADWADARRADESLLTEWQVYRMIDVQPALGGIPVPRARAAARGRRRRGAGRLAGVATEGVLAAVITGVATVVAALITVRAGRNAPTAPTAAEPAPHRESLVARGRSFFDRLPALQRPRRLWVAALAGFFMIQWSDRTLRSRYRPGAARCRPACSRRGRLRRSH